MTWRRGGCPGITGMLASSFRETLAGWPFMLSPVSGPAGCVPVSAGGLPACRLEDPGQAPPRPPFHGLVFPFAKCRQSLSAASGGSPSSQKGTEKFSLQLYHQQCHHSCC